MDSTTESHLPRKKLVNKLHMSQRGKVSACHRGKSVSSQGFYMFASRKTSALIKEQISYIKCFQKHCSMVQRVFGHVQ